MPSKNNKKSKKAATSSVGVSSSSSSSPAVPDNFQKIVTDMCADLTRTFPEYASAWAKWLPDNMSSMSPEEQQQEIQYVFEYCLTVFPERFFDILYKNEDLFKPENTMNTKFLPGVEFKALFQCEGVSENTCSVMWNYLQLILFTILGSVQDKKRFGETGNIFDGIDESDLFAKLSDTMNNMSSFFQNMGTEEEDAEGEDNNTSTKTQGKTDDESDRQEIPLPPQTGPGGMPNIKEIHEHLKGLFDGKIGALAKELAEDITGDFSSILGEDAKDIKSTQDVIQQLMRNPAKISQLIKTIGDKLKTKLSSGEVSQDELMKEATELLGKMKDMGGGMDQFKDLFKNMGVPMPKNAKIDVNALSRMTNQQSTRERLKKRMEQKKAAQTDAIMQMAAQFAQQQQSQSLPDLDALSREFGLDLNSKDGINSMIGSTNTGDKKKKKKK
jgi:hypothetical protein